MPNYALGHASSAIGGNPEDDRERTRRQPGKRKYVGRPERSSPNRRWPMGQVGKQTLQSSHSFGAATPIVW
jgi:hypothetical protein